MKKTVNFVIINPLGNITALVKDSVSKNRRPAVANEIMGQFPRIEQVGFIVDNKLEMMGGELSINATLAFGYYLAQKLKRNSLKLKTSGLSDSVKFQKTKNNASSILLSIPGIKKSRVNGFDFVDLKGIAYFVIKKSFAKKDYLSAFKTIKKRFGQTIKQKAWGVIFYNKNSICPIVYVKDTNTIVEENACGSGSLAFYLIKGKEKITQSSGQIMQIKKRGNVFAIKGQVRIISDKQIALKNY
ncbi:hypothetical protein ISS85_00155 [Candidatus Microgenomates bacterium]|nr:hypothetical protein [Candidatus Microgenomates bacterium]